MDLPDPGIEPGSPALQADSLSTELSGNPQLSEYHGRGGSLGAERESRVQQAPLKNQLESQLQRRREHGKGDVQHKYVLSVNCVPGEFSTVHGITKSQTQLRDFHFTS